MPPFAPSKLQRDMDLEQVAPAGFVNRNNLHVFKGNEINGNSFGGCLVYQALLAAYRTVVAEARDDPDHYFLCDSFHSSFISGVKSYMEIRYDVAVLREGAGFKHREVKAVQHGKVCFMAIVTFVRKNKESAPPSKRDTGPQPVISPWPIPNPASSSVWQNPFTVPGQTDARGRPLSNFDLDAAIRRKDATGQSIFVPDKEEKLAEINCVDILTPRILEEQLHDIFPEDKHRRAPLTSEDITNRSLYFMTRVRRPEGITEGESNADAGREPLEKLYYMHHLAMAYISDHNFLSTVTVLLGYPYKSEKFRVSLDHTIYFHETKHETSMYDWQFARTSLIKAQNGRVLVCMSVYNRFAEMMCYVTQEAFFTFENSDKKMMLPSDEVLISRVSGDEVLMSKL